jgi:acetoacetyl-CoA synthetase
MTEPLWRPSAKAIADANLTAFMKKAHARFGAPQEGYEAFHAWSVTEPEAFWDLIWDECGIIGEKGGKVLVDGGEMPGAKFFPEARLNFAENLLRLKGESPALHFNQEGARGRSWSWRELHDEVSRMAQAFRAYGLVPGDRVAAFMPNMPETVIAMLAAASIGAIWSSCSPDFGVKGVLDRFGQIEPKLLIACDGYRYNGKELPCGEKLAEIVAALPTLEKCITVPLIGADVSAVKHQVSWEEAAAPYEAGEIAFEPLPFAHPLYIMFSSGTTGAPKCIVHSAGGTLLQHLKEHRLHCDIKPGETLFYFTTCGWMMWNWLVSGLAAGATLALYDGSPFYPSGNVLFDYADALRVNVFGASAKFIDALKNDHFRPADTHDLGAMRMILSTGSPLVPEGFDYVYDAVKKDVALCSISGGTDIVSCFVLGNPIGPVYRGQIQAKGLGMAVEVWDEEGRPLSSGKGELVCTKPFPSMPIGFWNDEEGKKYRAAYFERFENVWCHGDFAEPTAEGGMIIHGRSDATLNPGGVRIGTAEIYAQVEQLEEVMESVAIGQDRDGDVRVVLFVVLRAGEELTDDLIKRIKTKIRTGASPRHVPAKVIAVADIPRTKSGKITELAVRDVVHGRAIKNKEALANPEALKLFENIAELQA